MVTDMTATSAVTKVTEVLAGLRAQIVHGKLGPGEKLRLEHLAPLFKTGRTPLREACNRLVSEGLVTSEEQRGFRVATISRADLLDVTRSRQQIESLAMRAAIQNGDVAWEADVTAALHRLGRAKPPAKNGDILDDDYERAHADLHRTLLAACDSPILMRIHATLFEQSERYRRLAVAYGQPSRDIHREHVALVKAALGRDAERACALLVEHIAATTERVLDAHPLLRA
jgi:GntR family carbon starvation induced transcriptional regulator